MNGHGEKYSRKREQALGALLTHGTVKSAARAAEVSESTLRRWLKIPEFSRRYRASREHLLLKTQERIEQATDDAFGVLHSLAMQPDLKVSLRIRAAEAFLAKAR